MKKIIFAESYFCRNVIFQESSRSFFLLTGKFYLFFREKINKWIEVFKLDVSLEQDIFVGTIFIGHLAEQQTTETKFLSYKVIDQLT